MIMLYGKFGFVFWPIPPTVQHISEKSEEPYPHYKNKANYIYNYVQCKRPFIYWNWSHGTFCPNFWILYLKKKI